MAILRKCSSKSAPKTTDKVTDLAKRIVRKRNRGLEMKPGSTRNPLKVQKNYGDRNRNPIVKTFWTKLIRDEQEKQTMEGVDLIPTEL